MPEIKIPFNDNLIDLSQTPSVKIIQSDGNYQLQIQVGLKKPTSSANRRANSRTTRLADTDLNIFSTGKAAVAFKRISAADPASKVTFVLDATLSTKVPHTGMVFSEFNLQALSALMEEQNG